MMNERRIVYELSEKFSSRHFPQRGWMDCRHGKDFSLRMMNGGSRRIPRKFISARKVAADDRDSG